MNRREQKEALRQERVRREQAAAEEEPRQPGGWRMASGRALTDEDLEALADEAERGYDVDRILAQREGKGDRLRRIVADAIAKDRDLSGIPYPPEALADSALNALAGVMRVELLVPDGPVVISLSRDDALDMLAGAPPEDGFFELKPWQKDMIRQVREQLG